jgi:hypothetical protein
MEDFCWTGCHWDRFSSEYSGFLCHSHSTSLPFSFIHLSPSLHYFFYGSTALVGLGLLFVEVLSWNSDTIHSVSLLWTSDWTLADTSTSQHTTLTRDKHPCPRRNSNPQSQQAKSRRPTSKTTRPLGSAPTPHNKKKLEASIIGTPVDCFDDTRMAKYQKPFGYFWCSCLKVVQLNTLQC